MRLGNVELHNVCEAEKAEDNEGVYLRRYPASVRESLIGTSLTRAQNSSGCEIRFVSDMDEVFVILLSKSMDSYAYTFCGDYLCERVFLPKDTKSTICIRRPSQQEGIEDSILRGRFCSLVYRVFISCGCEGIFYKVYDKANSVRPPNMAEKPRTTWYAYGSSITQGVWSLISPNSYIHYAAQRLGIDVCCKGMSGACFCEKEIIDYLAECGEWDIITLELGVNMYEFPVDEFRQRIDYAVHRICAENREKSVFVLTPFPNIASFGNELNLRKKHERFTDILLQLVEPNLKVIEGKKILDDYTYLSHDLLHPTDYGHSRMGENLAKILSHELGIDMYK